MGLGCVYIDYVVYRRIVAEEALHVNRKIGQRTEDRGEWH